jgi:putative peptidoglycan lipid II flippase
MFAFLLSTLTGLLRWVLVANAFGTSAEMEAFSAANRVSETLYYLVAGGALGSAFIPTFTGFLAKDHCRKAWEMASAVTNLVLLILIFASLLAAIFAPQIVRHILAPGFAADAYKFELTVSLVRLMLPSAIIFGISGLVMGILNSHQIFLFPALAPSMYALGMIFGVLFLAPGMGIYGLAWGVLLGAALHLLVQVPVLVRQGGSYTPTLGLRLAEVREVARLMGPRLLGVAVVQLNFWINVRLASAMPEGSVNGVSYAFTLMLMPQTVIAQSIATAAMPTFAAQYARGQMLEMRNSLAATLRGVLLLAIPASIGLILLRYPLVETLYQRGEFDAYSTALVAWALLWYGIGLVAHSVVEILARAFYALHDTRTPVLVGVTAMGLNVLFSFLFSAWFERWSWMLDGGLALANTVATGLEMLGLMIAMRHRLGGLSGRQILHSLWQAGIASIGMTVFLLLATNWMVSQPAWLALGVGVFSGALVYGVGCLLLRVPEARGLLDWLGRRLGRVNR